MTPKKMARTLFLSPREYKWIESGEKQLTYNEVMHSLALLQWRTSGDFRMPWEKDPPTESIARLKYALLYNTQPLYEILTDLAELAEEISCDVLQTWALLELTGRYPENSLIAAYRIFPKVYSVNFTNGKDRFDWFPVPYISIAPDDEEGRWSYLQGTVAGFHEMYLYDDGGSKDPANDMKSLIRPFLAETYGPDVSIIGITHQTSGRTFRKVVLAVQEIILNFILALEERFGPSPSYELLSALNVEVALLFGEAMIKTDKAEHLDIPIKPRSYDKYHLDQELIDLLYEVDAEEEHVEEMLDLLSLDKRVEKTRILGPEVNAFIDKMAELYPRLGPGGVKLREAYERYYGFDRP